ncbi:MAG: alpha/beta hydrolase [Leptolyngbyaceae cyanobacterium SM1_1_3]|nr:alpha/beta hydrolase [Leptolyngbyaceae cyanobacterium SM1_1_3]NJN04352.1 alpha/beta hydrolase [Leptolyngbyaceae cyanobacterium RM1_1_2]NJO09662.1 alpha/beta hydrolase [Leptolyngbyaceae cyanobacterium SL_1_1]
MQLAVQVAGSGFPILCLHGHPGSAQSMGVFTQHLSQQFKTLAPDLRGYGASRVQHPFVMADHLQDLIELLDQQQIERCWVLGWSLGGILALELALRCPDRIQGLILIATAARPRGSHPAVSWQDNAYTGIASIVNRIFPGWQWNIETFAKRSLYRYLLQQHTAFAYQRLANEGMSAYLQTSKFASQALSQALRQGYSRLDDLGQIQAPCLMLWGACDRHITPAASLETAQHLPNCDYCCYPHTAHLLPWEIPQQILRDIDRWLLA